MNQLKAIVNAATEREMNVLCNWSRWDTLLEIFPMPTDGQYNSPTEWIRDHQMGAVNFLKGEFSKLRLKTPVENRFASVNWIIDDVIVPATELVPTKTAARAGDVMRCFHAGPHSVKLYFGHDITNIELAEGKQYILTETTWDNIATEEEYNFILAVRRVFGFTHVHLSGGNLDFSHYGF